MSGYQSCDGRADACHMGCEEREHDYEWYRQYPEARMSPGTVYLMMVAGLVVVPVELARRACGLAGRVLLRVAGE